MCQAPCWGPYNAFQSPLMCTQTWPCPGSPVTLMSVCLSNGHFSLLDSFNLSVIVKPPDHCLQVKPPPFLFSVILCSSRVVSPIWVLLSPFLCWHIPHPPQPLPRLRWSSSGSAPRFFELSILSKDGLPHARGFLTNVLFWTLQT